MVDQRPVCPPGTRVPDEDHFPEKHPFEEEEDPSSESEAMEDDYGAAAEVVAMKEDQMHTNFMNPATAAAAKKAAQLANASIPDLLDQMETAEADYEASHPSALPVSKAPPVHVDNKEVNTSLRARVVEHLQASFTVNPEVAAQGLDPKSMACTCEQGLRDHAHSKSVYQSTASNAVRLAKSIANVNELIRVASGQPKPGHITGKRIQMLIVRF